MKSRKRKIKDYAVVTYISGSKLVTSAGQSAFAMNKVSEYILKSGANPAKYGMIGMAISSGALVNVLTRIPAIYRKYGPAAQNDASYENLEELHLQHAYSRICYYVLIAMAYIAAELNDPLGAYLGSIVMSEGLGNLFHLEVHDHIAAEICAQVLALVFSIAIALNNHAYDMVFLRRNVRELCEYIDNRVVALNKSMLETIIFSLPVLLGAPVLAYFFNKPALLRIPGASFILHDIGIDIVTGIMASAAFVRGITTLPSVYDAIYRYNNPLSDTPVHIRNYCKTTAVKVTGTVAGAFDSIAAGLCILVGVIGMLSQIFGLSGRQLYHWGLIIIASIFGASQAVQNMLFSVMPGLNQTLQDLNSSSTETLPLLAPPSSGQQNANINEDLKLSAIYREGNYNTFFNQETGRIKAETSPEMRHIAIQFS